MPAEVAADRVRDDVRAGRLDGDAATAVLDAAGHARTRVRAPTPAGLSEREIEVLRAMARGLGNREIAERFVDLAAHGRAPRPAHLHEDRGLQPRGRRPVRDGARPPRPIDRSGWVVLPMPERRSPSTMVRPGSHAKGRRWRARHPPHDALVHAGLHRAVAGGARLLHGGRPDDPGHTALRAWTARGDGGRRRAGGRLVLAHRADPAPVRRTPLGSGGAAAVARRRGAGLRGRPRRSTRSSTACPCSSGCACCSASPRRSSSSPGSRRSPTWHRRAGRARRSASTRCRCTWASRSVRSSASCCSRPAGSRWPGSAVPRWRSWRRAWHGGSRRPASPVTGDARPTPFFNRAALAPSVALFTGHRRDGRLLRVRGDPRHREPRSRRRQRCAVPVRADRGGHPGRVRPAARSGPAVPARLSRADADRRWPDRREPRHEHDRARQSPLPSSPPASRS